ncbi:MAG TPA: trimethylamine methyltransferase family protein [Thermoleophilia bacterium]|nr:trimethylamine methyltransferase family protein [Thermoleophilia bacterium]
MARVRAQYLSQADQEFVHEQTVRVLEDIGIAFNSEKAIDLLAEAGAPVDREALTAKVPWELVERCLASVPRRILLAGRDPQHDRYLDDDEPTVFCTDGTGTYMYDDVTGERWEGTEKDLREVMRLFEGLDEVDMNWCSICPRDVDPAVSGLRMAAIGLTESGKHLQDEVRVPEQVPAFIELLETFAGASLHERPIYSVTNCTIAPLQHDKEMTEAGLLLARAGVPIFVLPMPLMGTTGPMSVLGTCIVNMAELLSAVVLFQLAAPGCAVVSGVGSAAAEMRSGLYLCGAPEVALINMICIEMSHRYGLRTMGSAISTDAKACNLQAGAEGMMTGLASALLGSECILAFGLLDGAQAVSLVKAVLDCDTVGAIRRFVRDDPIDDSTSLFDDIREVGIGGHYLGAKSTRRFLRQGELWSPAVWQRGPFESYTGRSLAKDAMARAREIIDANRATPVDDDVLAHAEQIIAAYRATVV